jgi:hypothetical protein
MTWGIFLNDTPRDYINWIDVCLRYNPDMVFYIQDGWPTYKGETANLSNTEALKAIDAGHTRIQDFLIRTLYDQLHAKYPGKVHVIPAGAAVVEMLHLYYNKKLPGFDCVSEHLGGNNGVYRDGGHLSKNSGMEHLVGYLYYGMLYKRSPRLIEGYEPEGFPGKTDNILREVAWKSIINSPFSGVTDENHNGIGDETEE